MPDARSSSRVGSHRDAVKTRSSATAATGAPTAAMETSPQQSLAENEAINGAQSRREELLRIAGTLFAANGYKNTTVRDIADAAGIQSGSLYHHFDSKESMMDELLRKFQDALWHRYDSIMASEQTPRAKLVQLVQASFEAIRNHRAEVAIYQKEATFLSGFERFAYLRDRNAKMRQVWVGLLEAGIDAGEFRDDLDTQLVYRFLRDTVWVAVGWYRPGGTYSDVEVADQYLTILLEGISRSQS